MTSLTRDPLLAIAKGVLVFLMAVMVIAAIACVIAIPGILVTRRYVIAEISAQLHGAAPQTVIWAIIGLLLLAVLLLALLWKVFQLLKRIVDTVGEGDPFVPANAARLTTMAWLVLGTQLASIPMGAIGLWLSQVIDNADVDVDFDVGISGNGLLLMLVLFILARVFRQGAAMREELGATV